MSDVFSRIWKPDEGKKRSFKNLKISLVKIENEFELLEILGEYIASKTEDNPSIDRATRDSFLIHFRRIHNFLYAKDTDNKSIVASDFFENADVWTTGRIKETKTSKDFNKLADNALQSFSYGDDDSILGISSEDFKSAVDDIGNVFKQFIKLNLPSETPEELEIERGDEGDVGPLPVGKDKEIPVKEYGGDIVLYRTFLNTDGILEVQVLHTNKSVRALITNHDGEPNYFLTNIEKYINHQQSARRWLAEVVTDNQPLFEENKVRFIMSELD